MPNSSNRFNNGGSLEAPSTPNSENSSASGFVGLTKSFINYVSTNSPLASFSPNKFVQYSSKTIPQANSKKREQYPTESNQEISEVLKPKNDVAINDFLGANNHNIQEIPNPFSIKVHRQDDSSVNQHISTWGFNEVDMEENKKMPITPEKEVVDDEIVVKMGSLRHSTYQAPKPTPAKRNASQKHAMHSGATITANIDENISKNIESRANATAEVSNVSTEKDGTDSASKSSSKTTYSSDSITRSSPSLLYDKLGDSRNQLSPKSVLKYSERDIDELKIKLRQQSDTELGIIQAEMQQVETKLAKSEKARKEMENIVDEFEQTMQKMIEESKTEKQRHELIKSKIMEERDRSRSELNTIEQGLKDLRVKYQNLKTENDELRNKEISYQKSIDELRQDVVASEKRVQTVKSHAESKLNEANEAIEQANRDSERNIDLVKAKLQKAELQIKALENTISQKQSENSELMRICDDLINKIEKRES